MLRRQAAGDACESGPALGGDAGCAWTIPLLCLGAAIVACCLIFPAIDANRALAAQRAQLAAQLAHLDEQIRVNEEFLARLGADPVLAERLALRQMSLIRPERGVLALGGQADTEVLSPLRMLSVPPPVLRPGPEPASALLADPSRRVWILGLGSLLLLAGLLLDGTTVSRRAEPARPLESDEPEAEPLKFSPLVDADPPPPDTIDLCPMAPEAAAPPWPSTLPPMADPSPPSMVATCLPAEVSPTDYATPPDLSPSPAICSSTVAGDWTIFDTSTCASAPAASPACASPSPSPSA